MPRDAFEHPSVQECITVGCDLAWMYDLCPITNLQKTDSNSISHNDIVSYKKDLKSGIEHNFITVLKKNGFSTQQAMDRAGQLQKDCYRRWYMALANMPVWGESIDREVLKYIDACHSFPLGDLLWSLKRGDIWEPQRATGSMRHECQISRM